MCFCFFQMPQRVLCSLFAGTISLMSLFQLTALSRMANSLQDSYPEKDGFPLQLNLSAVNKCQESSLPPSLQNAPELLYLPAFCTWSVCFLFLLYQHSWHGCFINITGDWSKINTYSTSSWNFPRFGLHKTKLRHILSLYSYLHHLKYCELMNRTTNSIYYFHSAAVSSSLHWDHLILRDGLQCSWWYWREPQTDSGGLLWFVPSCKPTLLASMGFRIPSRILWKPLLIFRTLCFKKLEAASRGFCRLFQTSWSSLSGSAALH